MWAARAGGNRERTLSELRRDAEARARMVEEGMFVARWDGMRIDVFLPSIPFSLEAERTRTRVTDDDGWSGWFLSAESLAVAERRRVSPRVAARSDRARSCRRS